jgi:hypothetical protein
MVSERVSLTHELAYFTVNPAEQPEVSGGSGQDYTNVPEMAL